MGNYQAQKEAETVSYNEENKLLKQMLELGTGILKAILNISYIFKTLSRNMADIKKNLNYRDENYSVKDEKHTTLN